jgi:peptidyl-prolyl cis-trans isomerase C
MTARTQSVGTLAGLAALAILAQGVLAQPTVNPVVKSAAVVNGEPIPLADVEAVMRRQPPPAHPMTLEQRRQVQMEILGMMIDDMLMQQFLRKNASPADPAEVIKEYARFEGELKAKGQTVADFLKESGQTDNELRTAMAQMLQWANYIKGRVSEADVKKFYDENKDFFDQVQVRASHIVLRLPPTASEGERQSARARLTAIRQEIVAGKLDFAEAVKKHSQCPSASNGGDVGYITRKGAVDESFARAAFAMKIGDLSDVVQTDYGFHIIKVTERKPGTPSVYEKIKEDVREFCIEDMRQAVILQQRKVAQVEVNLP